MLSKEDMRNIEKGLANRSQLHKFNVNSYFDDFLMAWHDYREHDYPNGNSIIQRLEYWKTATRIIRSHWLTGTGTGDVADAFTQQYIKDQTHLMPKCFLFPLLPLKFDG